MLSRLFGRKGSAEILGPKDALATSDKLRLPHSEYYRSQISARAKCRRKNRGKRYKWYKPHLKPRTRTPRYNRCKPLLKPERPNHG